MSVQTPEQPIIQAERRNPSRSRKFGSVALAATIVLTQFGMLASDTDPGTQPGADRPAVVSMYNAVDSHPVDNNAVEGMLEHTADVHDEPSGKPEEVEITADAFAQDTSYGAHDKPGNDAAALVASRTQYGPIADVNQLQSVTPASQNVQAA